MELCIEAYFFYTKSLTDVLPSDVHIGNTKLYGVSAELEDRNVPQSALNRRALYMSSVAWEGTPKCSSTIGNIMHGCYIDSSIPQKANVISDPGIITLLLLYLLKYYYSILTALRLEVFCAATTKRTY